MELVLMLDYSQSLDKVSNDNHHSMYDYVLLYYEELVIDEDHRVLHELMDL